MAKQQVDIFTNSRNHNDEYVYVFRKVSMLSYTGFLDENISAELLGFPVDLIVVGKTA